MNNELYTPVIINDNIRDIVVEDFEKEVAKRISVDSSCSEWNEKIRIWKKKQKQKRNSTAPNHSNYYGQSWSERLIGGAIELAVDATLGTALRRIDEYSEAKRETKLREYFTLRRQCVIRFQVFVMVHEEIIEKIQYQINTINKIKPIIKDRLNELAILFNKQPNDYPMEYLDYRLFDNARDYDIAKQTQHETEEMIKDLESYWFSDMNFWAARKISKQTKKLKIVAFDTYNKMITDLVKLSSLNVALENIAAIYTDIEDKMLPEFREKGQEVINHYNSKADNLPPAQEFYLNNMTCLLTKLAEKQIIHNESIDKLTNISNDFSNDYNTLISEYKKVTI